MYKRMLKFISTSLVLILLMQMLPLQAFAKKNQASFSSVIGEIAIEPSSDGLYDIIAERTEKRTAYT